MLCSNSSCHFSLTMDDKCRGTALYQCPGNPTCLHIGHTGKAQPQADLNLSRCPVVSPKYGKIGAAARLLLTHLLILWEAAIRQFLIHLPCFRWGLRFSTLPTPKCTAAGWKKLHSCSMETVPQQQECPTTHITYDPLASLISVLSCRTRDMRSWPHADIEFVVYVWNKLSESYSLNL